MSEKYLTNFADQESALSYTSGDTTLVAPQVTLIDEGSELVYSKDLAQDSRIRFAKDEATGKLYFILDGVYYSVNELLFGSVPTGITYIPVDLGIKDASGKTIYFADRNVGASSPSDYGTYFSWGNVSGATIVGQKQMSEDYVIEQLIIMMLTMQGMEVTTENIAAFKNNPEMMNQINAMIPMVTGLISEYSFDENTYATTLGGQFTGSTLDAEHDAAYQWMGGDWRMPTSAETNELVEKTQHYYISLDGTVVGGPFNYNTSSSDKGLDGSPLRSICFVKSGETFNTDVYKNQYNSSNKYFIEIPFAGDCSGGLLGGCGTDGFVWSSSLLEGNSSSARYLLFSSGGFVYGGSHGRYYGQSVRGVRVGEVG